ncbi:hypothetical protein [Streptomyces camelliae]|uniref:Secreted protein n=1 Tax=Streptomyces camelliae TaxID=3004093 RepID=A0ABY7PB40_9ACTN|nr:hypothetical protein [Streptomyces sp. HUAS 2-6]WBO67820.1 hypothetical protein O1G22_35870 [Streptomyces sp. HUAS 2-6]
MLAPQSAPGAAGPRRRLVRPCVLVAVLLGLFLMHGGPAAADGGCHGAMPDTAPMHTAMTHADVTRTAGTRTALTHTAVTHRAVTHTAVTHTAVTRSAPDATAANAAVMPSTPAAHTPGAPGAVAAKAGAHPAESMRGALCLATTPRSTFPLPPLNALACALPAAALLPWARRVYGEARRRGPPDGGRDLLLQVCVART